MHVRNQAHVLCSSALRSPRPCWLTSGSPAWPVVQPSLLPLLASGLLYCARLRRLVVGGIGVTPVAQESAVAPWEPLQAAAPTAGLA